jgi:hypothetical protein
MTFEPDEDTLKRVAREISRASRRIQKRMIEDAMFGERKSYSPFVSTGRMARSIAGNSPLKFRPIFSSFDVVVSHFVVETKKYSREKKVGFWRRLLSSLTDLNPWPYSHIEYYEVATPAIVLDRGNRRIICHPSLEQSVREAIAKGDIR